MSLDLVTVPGWSQLSWLVHGFTTRTGGRSTGYDTRPHDSEGCGDDGGELNLGFTASDDPALVRENRSLLLSALGMPASSLVTVRQTHSATILSAGPVADQLAPCEGDGLITANAGVLLGILTADCVPVLVVDPAHRAVGAFHAGWRGTVQSIVKQGVARMQQEFGSNPGELLAAIGPSIGPCCYGVGENVQAQFAACFPYADQLFKVNGTTVRLDLWEANRRQLLDAGLPPGAVHSTQACTSCNVARFFSYRAEQANTGRMLAVAGTRFM